VVTESRDVGHSHHFETHERLADLKWFGNDAALRGRIGCRESHCLAADYKFNG
jgi:hypothetical protein